MALNDNNIRYSNKKIPTGLAIIVVVFIFNIWCSLSSMIFPHALTAIIPIFVLIGLFAMYPKVLLSNKAFICGCVFSIILLLVIQFHRVFLGYGSGGFDTWLIETAFLLPSLALSAVLSHLQNTNLPRFIFWCFVASFVLSLIFIGPVLMFHRDVARYISYKQMDDLNTEMQALKNGLWGYTAFHGIALGFAAFWGLYKYSSGKIRTISLLIALAILFVVVQIAVTTTFIYIGFVLLAIIYLQWGKHAILAFGIVAIVLAIAIIYINPILDWLLKVYAGSDMEPKIRDLIDIVHGGTGYHGTIDGRENFQQENIDAFLNNPLFGTAIERGTGGHSCIWMRFAGGGIFCGLFYLMMLFSLFIKWYRIFRPAIRPYYLLAWLGAIILLYNKGLFGEEGFSMIAVIVPAILLIGNAPKEKIARK